MIRKPIYIPKGRAKEYGECAVNIYTGCPHGCMYCYVPLILRKKRKEFLYTCPRKELLISIENQLKRESLTGKLIHLCFTCDPYPNGVDTAITREVIKRLKGSGNHVQILTKGGMSATRDFDLLDKTDSFGITFSCAAMADKVEPGAAPPQERLEALKMAKDKGITTWVSCEPIIEPVDVLKMVKESYQFVDVFKFGKLNHMKNTIKWKAVGQEIVNLCETLGCNYQIKNDLQVEIEGQ